MTNQDAYQMVTERMDAELAKGRVPWRQPWDSNVGMPRSIDGRPYRGINAFILGLSGFADPRWGTYNAIKRHGGQVRQGERGTDVVLWKPVKRRDPAEGEPGSYLLARTYRVFNAAQADGLPEPPATEPVDSIATADALVAGYSNGPRIMDNATGAWYMPLMDTVMIPGAPVFRSTEARYSTLFHELTHSTGHESRLDRFSDSQSGIFASESYSKEELVAELGAAMLVTIAGMEVDYPQSASYIAGWRSALAADPKLMVQAAARAQRAVDHIHPPIPTEADNV